MTTNPLLALAFLRVVVGALFVAHGVEKIFLSGLRAVIQQFAYWDIPQPFLTAPLVATTEIIGGALLIIGLATRPIALLLSFVMTGAIVLAHWNRDFFGPQGMELPLILLGCTLALVVGGPGQPAVDYPTVTSAAAPPAAPPRVSNVVVRRKA